MKNRVASLLRRHVFCRFLSLFRPLISLLFFVTAVVVISLSGSAFAVEGVVTMAGHSALQSPQEVRVYAGPEDIIRVDNLERDFHGNIRVDLLVTFGSHNADYNVASGDVVLGDEQLLGSKQFRPPSNTVERNVSYPRVQLRTDQEIFDACDGNFGQVLTIPINVTMRVTTYKEPGFFGGATDEDDYLHDRDTDILTLKLYCVDKVYADMRKMFSYECPEGYIVENPQQWGSTMTPQGVMVSLAESEPPPAIRCVRP